MLNGATGQPPPPSYGTKVESPVWDNIDIDKETFFK
jgi:hypothetical protein